MTKLIRAQNYMRHYRCSGPDCPDSCCQKGWIVPIAKEELNAVEKSIRGNRSLESCLSNLTLQISSAEEAERFSFSPKPEKPCAFIHAGHCLLHSELGEARLFKTCATYPRHLVKTADGVELSGQISCPEIARLCLELENPFDWYECDGRGLPAQIGVETAARDQTPWHAAAICLVREEIQSLLCRNGELNENLFLTMYLIKKVESLCVNRMNELQMDKLNTAIHKFNKMKAKFIKGFSRSELLPGHLYDLFSLILKSRENHEHVERFNAMAIKTNDKTLSDLKKGHGAISKLHSLLSVENRMRLDETMHRTARFLFNQYPQHAVFEWARLNIIKLVLLKLVLINETASKSESGLSREDWLALHTQVLYVFLGENSHNREREIVLNRAFDRCQLSTLSELAPVLNMLKPSLG
ncbi:MAG: hypothetical protein CSA81_10405 [Acidobacteria bacterium]|nr:MAG: hypothetical protein CSA81_10405 [Acidobacteriota bacterium]